MVQENGKQDLRGAVDLNKVVHQQPTHGTVNITAFVAHLDDEGKYPLSQRSRGNMGPARGDYYDAEQLIGAIRAAVHDELAAHGFLHE